MACQHLQGSICTVASALCGRGAASTPGACRACEQDAQPRQANPVTSSLALNAVYGTPAFDTVFRALKTSLNREQGQGSNGERLQRVLRGSGVGSQLWRMLEDLGVRHSANCDCLDWAERLNAWGPAGCRLARREIAEHLRDARRELGWAAAIAAAAHAVATGLAWSLNPLDPYGSLVDEAIRRAVREDPCLTAGPPGSEDIDPSTR